ncbi:hypothetical protein BDV29DRAFT_200745 [Aspergillus leporis]|uniref:C2H2 type zinc finger domain protein n=1 Tax=Aspergillus leporis TaxID=41062 RepID=A0A5N5WFT3_9EURO|nr:hypothetical protein BDV29DRAFT_200745 [Aspergillus leporis]
MGCDASFHRKEHLHRHETQHYRPQLFQCSSCNRAFGRSDTLRRHMHNVHGAAPLPKRACTHCREQKSRCQGGLPCSNCLRRGIHCSLNRQAEGQLGDCLSCPSDTLLAVSHGYSIQPKTGRSEKERHYLDQYFKLFHPYWPFIHQGTFKEDNEIPLLIQSMIVIGMWMSKEQDTQSKAIDIHSILSSAIHQQKAYFTDRGNLQEVWDASTSEDACSSCGGALNLNLKPSLTPDVADLLDRLVTSCKRLGMLYYPNMLNRYCQDDLASYVWIGIEEVKRFNMALFKVCRAFSSVSEQEGSINSLDIAGASRGLRARDLQFPLPRNTPLWNAVSKEEWVSAATEEVYCNTLNNTLEVEWISNSANTLELTEN